MNVPRVEKIKDNAAMLFIAIRSDVTMTIGKVIMTWLLFVVKNRMFRIGMTRVVRSVMEPAIPV